MCLRISWERSRVVQQLGDACQTVKKADPTCRRWTAKRFRSEASFGGYQFGRTIPFERVVERLREKKPTPGSLEAILVEAVKAQGRVETSPVSQRRIFERVLARALEQRSVRRLHRRVLLRSLVAGGLLSVAGATVASTLSRHWTGSAGGRVSGQAAPTLRLPPPTCRMSISTLTRRRCTHVHGRKVMNVSLSLTWRSSMRRSSKCQRLRDDGRRARRVSASSVVLIASVWAGSIGISGCGSNAGTGATGGAAGGVNDDAGRSTGGSAGDSLGGTAGKSLGVSRGPGGGGGAIATGGAAGRAPDGAGVGAGGATGSGGGSSGAAGAGGLSGPGGSAGGGGTSAIAGASGSKGSGGVGGGDAVVVGWYEAGPSRQTMLTHTHDRVAHRRRAEPCLPPASIRGQGSPPSRLTA